MRDMNEFEAEYEKKGVQILAVNAYEPPADGRTFIDGCALEYRWMFADENAARQLGVKAVPSQILLDREGVVVWTSSLSSVSRGAPAIREALDAALK